MAAPASASSVAARRLRRDLENLRKSQNPQIAVQPSEDNLLQWHFVLHSLPSDTPYHGGVYHGKIIFPPEYPHAPPAILMITPSGRLETERKLCLSMTDFHPESWNPAWSVETILVGLLSFFVSDAESGYGAITAPEERRRQLASDSHAVNLRNAEFRALFPEFEHAPPAEAAQPEAAQASASVPLRAAAGGVGALAARPSTEIQGPGTSSMTNSGDSGSAVGNVPGGADRAGTPSFLSMSSEGAAASQGPQAGAEQAGPVVEDAEDEAPTECWICRDTTDEPLIQPCACRGSMSGVHASCVEDWIRHHRRNAVDAEPPRCSVCSQPYRGYERRPGVADFLRHLCRDASQQLLRTFVLVLLMVAFKEAAQGSDIALPLPIRIVLIAMFSLAAVHKVMVLTVSLPPHMAPPRDPRLRRFFVADYRTLAMHIAEAFATFMIMSFWFLAGDLPLQFFLPFGLAALIPVAKMCLRHPSLACLRRSLFLVLAFALAPLFVVWTLITLVYRYPRRAVSPLDAGLHIAVAIAAIPLCLCCVSNVPVLVLWAVHSTFVTIGLIELFAVRRLLWHEGTLWWFALQLTALAAYIANALCEFPKGLGKPGKTDLYVFLMSSVWLCLVAALTVKTNWSLCVRYYRTWQHRHGTFTLQVPAEEAGDAGDRGNGGRAAPAASLPV